MPAPAGVHVPSTKVRILLPVGYGSGTTRYPVIYLLNGLGGNYTEWSTQSDISSYSAKFKAIFVMPDGGTNATAGWYSDWYDGSYQFESWQINSVVPWVNKHYRTAAGKNAVVGLSMGGFGALAYAGRHPGLFHVAASFSGLVDNQHLSAASGLQSPNMKPAWGDPVVNANNWAAHNPTKLASKMRGMKIFLACGSGSVTGNSAETEEYYLNQQQPGLVRALDAAGVKHVDDFYAGGAHEWSYWQTDMHWALPQILKAL